MAVQHQVLKGRGLLVSRLSGKEVEVAYRFDVTRKLLAAPGRAPVTTAVETRGSVKAVEGETLANEHYNLHTPEATYHVWRDEVRWHIEIR